MTRTTVTPISVVARGMSNAFLVRGDKAVLVDSGIPGAGPKIQAVLAELGVHAADVSAIVVTHGHIDHFGSAVYLKRVMDAPIIAHRDDIDESTTMSGTNGSVLARTIGSLAKSHPKAPVGRMKAATA